MEVLRKNMLSVGAGLLLTALGYLVGLLMGWITELNWLEVFCVFTSYVCTVLCVVQSRTNYIWGIVSVVALSFLFFQSGLYSSMVLNIYLIPTLAWGWYRWKSDANPRPVTFVRWGWWPVYLGFTGIVWWNLSYIADYMGASLPVGDSFILAGSILAQFLLDQKKIETWVAWFIVNIVAIKVYGDAGLYMVVFQYVFFLLNTALGGYTWFRTMEKEKSYV